MIRTIIVDDEPLACRNIRRFLRMHKDIEVVSECHDGPTALESALKLFPDLLFLDIHLPGRDGLEMLAALGEARMPSVIFTTAHADYALSAFEAEAVDYILKPFGQDRFNKALERYKRRRMGSIDRTTSERITQTTARMAEPTEYLDRLPIMLHGRIVLIKVEEVLWIESNGSGTLLHTSKTSLDARHSLMSLQGKLDPRRFVRIHRSTIVNIDKIREITPWFNGYHLLILDNGKELRMSRYQEESARRLLGR